MTPEAQTFVSGEVRPFACLREGWELIRESYWLLVLVCFLALLFTYVPLVLIGPAFCGLSVVYFQLERRAPVTVDLLFRGLNYFSPSLIVTLMVLALQMLLLVPFAVVIVLIFIFGVFGRLAPGPGGPDVGSALVMMGAYAVGMLGFMLVGMAVFLFTFFAYPLLVERQLEPVAALRLSARAAWANFWPLVGLFLLNGLLLLAGVCCCYVGALLVFPLIMAALLVAYRKIFPLLPTETPPPLPEDGVPG